VKADSIGRRNTSITEVRDGTTKEAAASGAGGGASAVGSGSGLAPGDAFTGEAGAVTVGAACVLAVDRYRCDH